MGPVDTADLLRLARADADTSAGLQGCGKTTTAAKLAKYIMDKGQKPMLVADDLQGPAAIDQLVPGSRS